MQMQFTIRVSLMTHPPTQPPTHHAQQHAVPGCECDISQYKYTYCAPFKVLAEFTVQSRPNSDVTCLICLSGWGITRLQSDKAIYHYTYIMHNQNTRSSPGAFLPQYTAATT